MTRAFRDKGAMIDFFIYVGLVAVVLVVVFFDLTSE